MRAQVPHCFVVLRNIIPKQQDRIRNGKRGGDLLDSFEPWHRLSRLPLADRLASYPQHSPQALLGEAEDLAVFPNAVADRLHAVNLVRVTYSAQWKRHLTMPEVGLTLAFMDHGLEQAVEAAGGVSALAQALGVSSQAISQWKKVPPMRLLAVSRVTGIPGHVLRPDVCSAPHTNGAASVSAGKTVRKRTKRLGRP